MIAAMGNGSSRMLPQLAPLPEPCAEGQTGQAMLKAGATGMHQASSDSRTPRHLILGQQVGAKGERRRGQQ